MSGVEIALAAGEILAVGYAISQARSGQQAAPITGMRLQTSAYGLPVPIIYGRTRVYGNCIWYGDFYHVNAPNSSSGGKGGGGKGGGAGYNYYASFMFGIGEGPITNFNGAWIDPDPTSGVLSTDPLAFLGMTDGQSYQITETRTIPANSPNQVWVSQYLSVQSIQSVVDTLSGNPVGYSMVAGGVLQFSPNDVGRTIAITYTFVAQIGTQVVSTPYTKGGKTYYNRTTIHLTRPARFSGFDGTYPQSPWSYLNTNHPEASYGYPGVAYVGAANFLLGTNNTALPNISYDVTGLMPYNNGAGIFDASPKDIVTDFLTNSHYGCGFPAAHIGDLTQFGNYCVANGLLFSPAYTQPKAAHELLSSLIALANCGSFYSEGLLKVVPFSDTVATGNGVTYTPNATPIYALNDTNFIVSGSDDPVKVTRKAVQDAYNHVQVQFLDRANQYNQTTFDIKDQASIEALGDRVAPLITAHEIANPAVARIVGQLALQRMSLIRNQYEFTLPMNYCLLEPGDYVTLTDANLGLSSYPVRLLSIEEDAECNLKVTAEDALPGVSHSTAYITPWSYASMTNLNGHPGNVNTPAIFEPPAELLTNQLEVWIAASGASPMWGGCAVWISYDNATYELLGNVPSIARQGVLTAALPASGDPDTVDTLAVDLSESNATLQGSTQADADAYLTLAWIDQELIAYGGAALVSGNAYNLTYIRRGIYGTPIQSHNAGATFTRLDTSSMLRLAFSADKIGKTLYAKFLSYNSVGASAQQLSDVRAYQYAINGSALNTPLNNVQNLVVAYQSGIAMLTWNAVSNPFGLATQYEIRFGPTFGSSSVIATTGHLLYPASQGDGTYWVRAVVNLAYSQTPTSVAVSGALSTVNPITFDEVATGWSGNLSSGAVLSGGILELNSAGNILGVANVLTMGDVLWYGGVQSSGEYDFPAAHSVNIGRVAACNVFLNTTYGAESIYDNVLTAANILADGDVLQSFLGSKVSVTPQIAIAPASGVYGAWQNFTPGAYSGQYFKARLLLASTDASVTVEVLSCKFTVDVPNMTLSGQSVAIAAAGTSIAYASPYNGGPNGAALPSLQATIANAQQGDTLVISSQTLNGFTAQVLNGGVGVARNINWQAQGY
ncbi:hypothetical protein GALL_71400 [mine drainage metagenome]|uniref:Uncharacterized protein n=1 Tax=mine drainage metagenome TaxID=410659 RepID=A0A1J5SR45_9ZZZZ